MSKHVNDLDKHPQTEPKKAVSDIETGRPRKMNPHRESLSGIETNHLFKYRLFRIGTMIAFSPHVNCSTDFTCQLGLRWWKIHRLSDFGRSKRRSSQEISMMKTENQITFRLAAVSMAILLGACSGGKSSISGPSQTPSPGVGTNSAPTISGIPPSSVKAGDSYSFTPQASDPDGDLLTFSIENQPSWASFDSGTGGVTGVPSTGDIGNYANIRISVSDGQLTASTPSFSIDVTQVATASTTLSWTAPTQNEDGSTLTDLAGYKIFYGTSPGNYSEEIRIDNPSVTVYVVDNLTPDTYYFAAKAFNAAGVDSRYSGEAVKIVN